MVKKVVSNPDYDLGKVMSWPLDYCRMLIQEENKVYLKVVEWFQQNSYLVSSYETIRLRRIS